ncbi:hypothetical protein KSP40_PGU012300 [Platanthera guangdongensis]|uniref:PHD-type domain-containing protein n=1 Tax=Platanthera guangdongensis TaxID=2320717 RepID=A0ABR2MB45_9ASPA
MALATRNLDRARPVVRPWSCAPQHSTLVVRPSVARLLAQGLRRASLACKPLGHTHVAIRIFECSTQFGHDRVPNCVELECPKWLPKPPKLASNFYGDSLSLLGAESFNGFNDDKCRAISLHLLESPKHCHQHENAKTTSISCTRIGTLKKRHRQTSSKKFIGETAIISLNEELPFGSNEIFEDSSRGKKSSKKERPLRSTRKVHARSRKPTNLYPKSCTTSILNEINELVDAQGEVPANSSKAIHDIESTSKTLAESSHSKSMDVVVAVQNKCQKRTKKATPKTPSESKRPSSDLAELEAPDTNLLGNPRKDKSPNHELDKTNSRCQLSSFKQNGCQGSHRTMFGLDKKFKVDAREQGDQEMRNMQNVDMLAAKPYHKVQQDNQPFLNLHKSYVTSKAKELLHLPTNEIFKKCKNVPSPVKCAFCHSSSDSEVTIHTVPHMAPDVFFNDDLVINLSTELARSRRITCSCCGIKGAALGCFEKSCRRSFHYPCAKQTPECRWDYVSNSV